MPYGKVDELAINTIRTLAVCHVPSLLRRLPLQNSYPAIAALFLNTVASSRDEL